MIGTYGSADARGPIVYEGVCDDAGRHGTELVSCRESLREHLGTPIDESGSPRYNLREEREISHETRKDMVRGSANRA